MKKQKTKRSELYVTIPQCNNPVAQYYCDKKEAQQYCKDLTIPCDLYKRIEVYR